MYFVHLCNLVLAIFTYHNIQHFFHVPTWSSSLPFFFKKATIMFHCVELSQPIKSFPSWSSWLLLLWNIYFSISQHSLPQFLNSWMIFHCIYHILWTHVGHLGCVHGLGQSKAGHRDTCWDPDGLNLQLRDRDNGHVQGNQGFKKFSHRVVWSTPWTFISAPVYPSVTHAQAFVSGCLKMPLASSQLPVVIF